jgi:hypothetical protein
MKTEEEEENDEENRDEVIELKIIILIKLMNATEMNQSSININLL